MEIPVHMIQVETFDKCLQRGIFKEEKKTLLMKKKVELEEECTKQCCLPPRTLIPFYEEEEEEEELKKDINMTLPRWISTVELEEDFVRYCTVEKIHVKVKVQERLVVLKIRNTFFKRIIEVPEFVNIQALKVKLLITKKVIRIEAPHRIHCDRRLFNEELCFTKRPLDIPVEMMMPEMVEEEEEEKKEQRYMKQQRYFFPTLREECQLVEDKKICFQETNYMMPPTTNWLRTIQLEEELFFHSFQREQIRCRVDKVLRVVVLKFYNRSTPFQRIIRVPEHVNIELIKLEMIVEKRCVLIKAPFLTTMPTTTAAFFQRQREEELMPLEYEPTVYKMLKHLRRQCPLLIPRIFKCKFTNELRLHLDLDCNQFIRPEEVLVMLKKCQKVLLITRRDVNKHMTTMTTTTTMKMQRNFFFELNLPHEFVDVTKFKTVVLDERTMRITFPFVQKVPHYSRYFM